MSKTKLRISTSQEIALQRLAKNNVVTTVFLLSLVVFFILGIIFGPIHISISEVFEVLTGNSQDRISESLVLQLRLPRLALAVLAGGALSVSGAALQALFNNPLAEPGLIGISSGAMLSVLLGIILFPLVPGLDIVIHHYSLISYPVLAFCGSLGVGALVYLIANYKGRVNVTTMLLAGIAANAFCGSVAGFLIFLSDDVQLRTITFWTMGSLGGANWKTLLPVAFMCLVGVVLILKKSKELECLSLGERQAAYIGIQVESVKRTIFFATALAAGSTIALTGIIGFVGLVVPHLIRNTSRMNMKHFLVSCFFVGGGFLVVADILSKVILPPSELSIGIITSAIGTPYFIYLLTIRKKRYA